MEKDVWWTLWEYDLYVYYDHIYKGMVLVLSCLGFQGSGNFSFEYN